MSWADALFNRGKFVRRFGMLMVFIMDLAIVWVMLDMILDQKGLPDGWLPVILEILALNAVYIGLYQWSRSRDVPLELKDKSQGDDDE